MVTRTSDGGTWRIGTDAEVAWTPFARPWPTISAAIPPVLRPTPPSWWRTEKNGQHDRAVSRRWPSSRRTSDGGWGISTQASMTSSSPMRRK
jgi:hypothetical protein